MFICTGNIFRSLSAEQCFKQYLADQNITGWKVGSAGIIAEQANQDPKAVTVRASLGVANPPHRQRKVSQEILDAYDIVVCMAQNHMDFLAGEFGYKQALLFNTLALGENTSVFDIEDVVPDYKTNRAAVEEMIEGTIRSIHAKIPNVFKNAQERFYLFSDFVSGKRTHRNGLPFIALHETPHTVAFMSMDIPRHGDGHILVIPKKRFVEFSHIPMEIAQELFMSLATIGKALGKHHDGYNILLNNGVDAGQYIFHTHFHMVPRRHGDGIEMEGWQHDTVSPEKFVELNEKLKKQITAGVY